MSAPSPTRPGSTGPGTTALGGRDPDGAPSRLLIPVLAGLVSLVYAVLAGIWTIDPSTNRFADPESFLARDSSLLLSILSPAAAARVLLALSLGGIAVAAVAVAARERSIRNANGLVGGFGIAYAVVVGLGLLSEVAISIAGYLMALVVAVGAVVLGVQIVRTSRLGRWVVAGIVAALVAVFAADVLPVSALGDLGGRIVDLLGQFAAIGLVLGLVAAALLWALVGGQAVRDTALFTRVGGWVLRHRRAITIIAAMGPAPYALIRLTWLTPWPQITAGETMPAEMRIWGLMLSSGAWAGIVLTIGLIRRWGEVFPRWMPLVAGRPVPVWVAAGPGSVVAAILCVSAVPMIRMFATQSVGEAIGSAIVFPLWFWGPALALAVWGYVLHRRQAADVAGTDGAAIR